MIVDSMGIDEQKAQELINGAIKLLDEMTEKA